MKKLVPFDERLRVRAELNAPAVARAGAALAEAIERETSANPSLAPRLRPLLDYARAGIAGRIREPRTWAQEPLQYEYGEGLLPDAVQRAYDTYAFHTHGLTTEPPKPFLFNGRMVIEVDDAG